MAAPTTRRGKADPKPTVEAQAVDETKALVQQAIVERADRNEIEVAPEERAVVQRHFLDSYLRRPTNLTSLDEQLRGSGIEAEAFVRSLVTLVTTNDALAAVVPPSNAYPEVISAFNRSVMRCALNIAALRLDPSPYYGNVYVVPFKTKIKVIGPNGKPIEVEVSLATLIVGYQGYVVLGARAGWEIDGGHIWEGQQFEYNRFNPAACSLGALKRVPDPDELPEFTWWSATNILTGRTRLIIEPFGWYLRAREYSQSWRGDQTTKANIASGKWSGTFKPKSPWSTAPLPMVLKTAVRWNRKLIPQGDKQTEAAVQWAYAHRIDGAVFSGAPEQLDAKKLWLPTAQDVVDRNGEPDDGGTLLTITSAADEPDPAYLPDAWYLAEIRAMDGGRDVRGLDVSDQVLALVESHGWDPYVAMPVLTGEKRDPTLPRELLVAVHAVCEAAIELDGERAGTEEHGS